MKRLVATTVGDHLTIECRKFVAETLRSMSCSDPEGWILLLADELVANAIEAGTEHFELTIEDGFRAGMVHVSVIDDAGGFPMLQAPGPLDLRGRGLQLVNRLATAWGTRLVERGKETWFDFEVGVQPVVKNRLATSIG